MHTEVLIAGAGLSGLALTHRLIQQGTSCLLFEARDRVGGRILSIDSDRVGPGKAPADMGPSWIWPGQPRIAALLRQFGIAVFEQYSAGYLVYEDERGQVRRDLDYSTMAGSLRIDGGIGRLTQALAASLPNGALQLGHRLRRIRKQDDGFRVDLEHGQDRLQVQADKIVLAIPPRLAAASIDFAAVLDDAVIRELAAIPTWMAGHAKVFVLYETPFWRDAGLSGDGISRIGPLQEIHDASGANPGHGALFGFVGLAASAPARAKDILLADSVQQLQRMFGAPAATPLDVIIQDWAREELTATAADAVVSPHPQYAMPAAVAALARQGLVFASSEMASHYGGFIEGALEASENAAKLLSSA